MENFLAFESKILPETYSAPSDRHNLLTVLFYTNCISKNENIFSFESFHRPLEIFFLDSVGLRYVLPSEAVASLPVVLGLQPQLLELAGGAGHGPGGEPGGGHQAHLPLP